MQQAARLAARLRRELEMMQSDPPPGACVWPSDTLLTRLEAQIQGPDHTVYAKGMFGLEIQIPERYPFEPPSIRFKTPIYHPNIDNGGRICLDLLNMPPKGSWKPSLNISTLLTSIGLLLAEPNPDDGLMGEITAEYKQNRSSFDLKAREWTEQYATQRYDGGEQTFKETGEASNHQYRCSVPEALMKNQENSMLLTEQPAVKEDTVAKPTRRLSVSRPPVKKPVYKQARTESGSDSLVLEAQDRPVVVRENLQPAEQAHTSNLSVIKHGEEPAKQTRNLSVTRHSIEQQLNSAGNLKETENFVVSDSGSDDDGPSSSRSQSRLPLPHRSLALKRKAKV